MNPLAIVVSKSEDNRGGYVGSITFEFKQSIEECDVYTGTITLTAITKKIYDSFEIGKYYEMQINQQAKY